MLGETLRHNQQCRQTYEKYILVKKVDGAPLISISGALALVLSESVLDSDLESDSDSDLESGPAHFRASW